MAAPHALRRLPVQVCVGMQESDAGTRVRRALTIDADFIPLPAHPMGRLRSEVASLIVCPKPKASSRFLALMPHPVSMMMSSGPAAELRRQLRRRWQVVQQCRVMSGHQATSPGGEEQEGPTKGDGSEKGRL